MRLISCDNCGIVLDKDKLNFPDVYDIHRNVIINNVEWNGYEYVAKTECPVCKSPVLNCRGGS